MCQLSHRRFAPSCGDVGAGCQAEVVANDPFRLLRGHKSQEGIDTRYPDDFEGIWVSDRTA